MKKLLEQAFTLIELLVVIAIIGILSGLIIVGMSGMTNSANIAKSQVFSNSLRNALLMNMVGEWKFNNGTVSDSAIAGDVLDTWGTNNATTVGTAPGPIIKGGNDCVSGKCLSFDGNDYVNIPHSASLNFGTGNFTLSLWVKTTMAGDVSGKSVISKSNVASPRWDFVITRDTSYIEFIAHDGVTSFVQYFSGGYYQINDGKWHFLTLVENYGVGAILYIEGKNYTTSSTIFPSLDTSANNLRIGGGGSYGSFTGLIDDVRIYDATMPASQIKEQYYTGLNSLLSSGQINTEEYSQRINSVAKE